MRINKPKLNFTGFKYIEKAYTEGIYADSPLNRKLGRVGMTYTAYAEYTQRKKEGEDVDIQDFRKSSENILNRNKAILKDKLKPLDDFNSTTISLSDDHKAFIEKEKGKYNVLVIDKNKDIVDKFNFTSKEQLLNDFNAYLYEADLNVSYSTLKYLNNKAEFDKLNKKEILSKIDNLKIERKWGEDEIISPTSIFKNSYKSKTAQDLTKFITYKFGVKEKYQVNLDKIKNLWDNSKVEEINIENIIPSQNYINKTQLKKYINEEENSSDKIYGIRANENSDKVILWNGHHRVASSILKGDKNIKMNIITNYDNKLFK